MIVGVILLNRSFAASYYGCSAGFPSQVAGTPPWPSLQANESVNGDTASSSKSPPHHIHQVLLPVPDRQVPGMHKSSGAIRRAHLRLRHLPLPHLAASQFRACRTRKARALQLPSRPRRKGVPDPKYALQGTALSGLPARFLNKLTGSRGTGWRYDSAVQTVYKDTPQLAFFRRHRICVCGFRFKPE